MRPTLAALSLLLAPLLAAPADAEDLAPRITVTGEGQVEAPPDLAILTAGVQTEAARAADAMAATAAAMRDVFAALAERGIAPEDMQTSQLSVDALWSDADGQPRVRGYAASNLVTVRVRDIAGLGPVIDALGAAGANRIHGVSFEIDEPRAQLDAARTRAVADAQSKAELLAEAAGVTLGPVLSMRETRDEFPGPVFARAEMAMDTPVAEGVVALEARVEIVYAIEQ